jgi:hypothetical protein
MLVVTAGAFARADVRGASAVLTPPEPAAIGVCQVVPAPPTGACEGVDLAQATKVQQSIAQRLGKVLYFAAWTVDAQARSLGITLLIEAPTRKTRWFDDEAVQRECTSYLEGVARSGMVVERREPCVQRTASNGRQVIEQHVVALLSGVRLRALYTLVPSREHAYAVMSLSMESGAKNLEDNHEAVLRGLRSDAPDEDMSYELGAYTAKGVAVVAVIAAIAIGAVRSRRRRDAAARAHVEALAAERRRRERRDDAPPPKDEPERPAWWDQN